ncbi:hypothetical protein N656DRAFT_636152 [Canariomyces notabilis]|uniref:Uncharacterized protein n=1 Tax=Canariomyces notabilis TaxID=2074819 RepID=A0AAN6TEK0_9PEZI|nr:hypothetical protein N656DRAFT_636152 [Canariomyces arenarius]
MAVMRIDVPRATDLAVTAVRCSRQTAVRNAGNGTNNSSNDAITIDLSSLPLSFPSFRWPFCPGNLVVTLLCWGVAGRLALLTATAFFSYFPFVFFPPNSKCSAQSGQTGHHTTELLALDERRAAVTNGRRIRLRRHGFSLYLQSPGGPIGHLRSNWLPAPGRNQFDRKWSERPRGRTAEPSIRSTGMFVYDEYRSQTTERDSSD